MKVTTSLRKNYQFLKVYKKGNFVIGRHVILYCLKNDNNGIRLGITASRKVGNSVFRNRMRRLLKESYRKMEELILGNFDIVFVVRTSEKSPTYYEIKKEMKYLLKKVGLTNNSDTCLEPRNVK